MSDKTGNKTADMSKVIWDTLYQNSESVYASATTEFAVGGCYDVFIYDGEIAVYTLTTPSSVR